MSGSAATSRLLFVISGGPTVVEEDGVHPLGSGDGACWPVGATSAHKVVKRPGASCTYPSLEIRAARDIVH